MKYSLLAALAGTAAVVLADTQVNWSGCSGERGNTKSGDGDCTNVAGFRTSNLCEVYVPPPGTDRCEFYTTPCGVPWGDTYYCSVASGKCNARPWNAIRSFRCWA